MTAARQPSTAGAEAHDRIFEERAAALARPTADEAEEPTADLIVAVADQRVALPAQRVRAIVEPGATARISTGGPLVGLRSVRGEVLAVADLAHLLQLTSATPASQRWLVVLTDPVAPIGLLVDAAVDLGSVPPDASIGPEDERQLVAHVTPDGVLVLDVERLLTDARLFVDAGLAAERPGAAHLPPDAE